MNKLLPVFCLAAAVATAADLPNPRVTESFDKGWRFVQADPPDGSAPVLKDSTWRIVDVPHDWSIYGPFDANNQTGGAGAFLPSGVCWYRKHFVAPVDSAGRRAYIEFDGVMQNSEVWINGTSLGSRPSGYVSFGYELTPYLKPGQDNVLAVRCDTSEQPASRWYSGAGIYRHVRLVTLNPLHIATDGVFASTPEVSEDRAIVRVETTVTNEAPASRKVTIETSVNSPSGRMIALNDVVSVITNGTARKMVQQLIVQRPQLWDLDSPKLYKIVTKIYSANTVLDETATTIGIRDAHFDANTGFSLNGRNLKLKGVCLHHDGGAFGAAVPLAVWQDRLQSLKSLGVNAIRTAHNPPAPEFLDLCDRMGFLVMDEFFDCWTVAKTPYDYHLYFEDWSRRDEADTIRRDRNHPSVVIYSVGNEIHDTPKQELAKSILAGLVETAHENDPTRPVTQALFRPNASGDYIDGLADMLDVVGQNYREPEILAAHAQKPSRKIIGTENTHDRKAWTAMRDSAPYAGQFIWTGIDYLGESRRWPVFGHQSGLLDRTGRIRALAYERESWWSDAPMVAIARRVADTDQMPVDPGYGGEERHRLVLFSDWTPANLNPHDEKVEVYSNCKQVELFLNGKSLGSQLLNADASPRVWTISFAPGELKAVASDGRNVVATQVLRTAGRAVAIRLNSTASKLSDSWDDAAVVRATVVDADGNPVPLADNLISFTVEGPGLIVATDNGQNDGPRNFQSHQCQAFQGECAAFVKASHGKGRILISAEAPGLIGGSAVIDAGPPE